MEINKHEKQNKSDKKIKLDINYIDEIKLEKELCINENYRFNL
ncbi:MAG: hypothetical protein N4A48_13435 [Tepidibacter sp.]|nr:hypothetical protein [Tepidibacter sp.]MCT4509732.1 hypothetical protein [Tepidibacter sp.]